MFVYEKKLQYPVRIRSTNPRLASLIITQYGGPDGELGASLRSGPSVLPDTLKRRVFCACAASHRRYGIMLQ